MQSMFWQYKYWLTLRIASHFWQVVIMLLLIFWDLWGSLFYGTSIGISTVVRVQRFMWTIYVSGFYYHFYIDHWFVKMWMCKIWNSISNRLHVLVFIRMYWSFSQTIYLFKTSKRLFLFMNKFWFAWTSIMTVKFTVQVRVSREVWLRPV